MATRKTKTRRKRPKVSRPTDVPQLGKALLLELRRHIEQEGWEASLLIERLRTVAAVVEGDLRATEQGELRPWSERKLQQRQEELAEHLAGPD